MENKVKKKKDDWIRLASKSRPGRFYMFNKATGETQWLPLSEVAESEKQKQDSPPKVSINKSSKTPAQDRLKRLQHNLKTSQTRSNTTRTTRHSKDLETKSKEQENQLKDEPSTSSSTKLTEKSPKKATKRTQSSSLSNELEISVKSVKSSTLEPAKKIRLSDSSTTSGKLAKTETVTAANDLSKSLNPNSNPEHLQNMDEDSSSTLSNIRTGIVKKIKEICKMPFNMSKKKIDEKSSVADNKSSSLINTTQFKPARKINDNKKRLSSSAAQESISKFIEENAKTTNMKRPTNHSELGTPKNLNIPTYPRGSANSRLERLKQSLLSQQQPCKSTNDSDTLQETTKSSTETNNNNNATSLLLEDIHQTGHNNSINSLYQTANNTINDEVEAMDWQPIVKDEESIEITSSESSSLVIEKSNKLLFSTIDANKNETMGDIYDTVNENLLRFSAEKYKDNNKKWQKDFYYFIVDTNVLLRDLSFVEDLTKMKLCDTKGSMLYVPYAVLQELDKLKMRSGVQEGVKTRAVRAIKYLNSKFENDSPHLQAQSALDERHRLVDINSADDSIMNCCLQAKQHVRNLLLLTEDVNLRNKAICNNILVSTKSDLMSKRYESSNTDDKS